jgi:hypothetical protein
MGSVVVARLLDGRTASDPQLWSTHWHATVAEFLCSVAMWSVWVSVLLAWSRKRGVFGSLVGTGTRSRALLVPIVGVLVLAVIVGAGCSAAPTRSDFDAYVAEIRAQGMFARLGETESRATARGIEFLRQSAAE